jgi:hypothetical protein
MWILSTLLLAVLAVAAIEHAHWYFITRRVDEAMMDARLMDCLREQALAHGLEAMTEMAESLYLTTSQAGSKYHPTARRLIAHNVLVARLTLAAIEGEPNMTAEAGTTMWPFDKEGGVKVDG